MVENSGIRKEGMDRSVLAKDDLFLHMNGEWIKNSEIPADKARYGWFAQLAEDAELAVQQIAEECVSTPSDDEEAKIGKLYSSFMNETLINQLGKDPLLPIIEEVSAISNIEEFFEFLAKQISTNIPSFFGAFVDNDPGDPSRYILFLEQSGIGLPDEQYYREDRFAPIIEAYKKHIARTLELIGEDQSGEVASTIVDLERRIARCHWDNVTCRDQNKTYNLTNWGKLEELIVAANPVLKKAIERYFKEISSIISKMDEIVIRQPSFYRDVAMVLGQTPLEDLKSWLKWGIARSMSPYLSDDFVQAHFDFYSKTLTGTPELSPRWKRAVSLLNGALGEAVGKSYVKRHFDEDAKRAMDELVANLIEAYRQSINELNWMSKETKIKAIEKLEQFTPKIGYPKKWRDYSGLEVVSTSLVANIFAISRFSHDYEMSKIGSPINRDEWFMNPQTVNAYYNPGFNEIVFPAAILQFPFFDKDRDDAANYGAIGAVIGHEIGHGFDDQGSKFDGNGKMENWWSDSDREAFELRAKKLIDQYNALSPRQTPHLKVNGELTVGENIGDLGGLGIGWKAYLISLKGQEAPVIDELTGAQRFFLSWAQAWREKRRDAEMERLITIDPHSPSEFRCNQIAKNLDAFHEAFGTDEASGMWLDPNERVSIW
ncbi:MAG: peptidase M13 [Actinomycetota bacterium]|nr:peptidase M13 [Actinomycetota bacterium]